MNMNMTTNQLALRQVWLNDSKSYISIRRNQIENLNKDHVYYAMEEYVAKYFDSNMFLVTKSEIRPWLIPSMEPLPDLFVQIVEHEEILLI